MLPSRYFIELTQPEIAAQLKANPMVILPAGSVEQHGPHLPTGTDTFAANVISAAVTLERDTVRVGAITPLFPHVKVGPRKQHDVSPDGRIIAATRNAAAGAAPLTLLVNWPALVPR